MTHIAYMAGPLNRTCLHAMHGQLQLLVVLLQDEDALLLLPGRGGPLLLRLVLLCPHPRQLVVQGPDLGLRHRQLVTDGQVLLFQLTNILCLP